jgi:Flp pilus assembly protein TadD
MGRFFITRRTLIWLGAATLSLLTILVYLPASRGGFVWDDDQYVTHNYLLTAPDGLRRIWFSLDAPSQYFPLTYTVLRVERSLWDLHPSGYHWTNIVFHLANALLVWRLLARLRIPGAWLVSAIFALHPIQAESVAWISELKNVLMGFFFLLTLLIWVEYVDPKSKHRGIFYLAALLFYLLALSAKATACTLPAALLLILWLKRKPIGRRTVLEIAPFVVLALGIGLTAVWWEKYHQGTRMLVSLGPLERLLIASRAVWFYLGKLFWPAKLTFIYPQWQIDTTSPVAYLWLIAAIILVVAIYFARRVFGRSLEVAALFFVTTLGPLLGFVMLYTFRYTFVADHYQYLACIGPIALVSAGLVALGRSSKTLQWLVTGASVTILICLALLTWRQSGNYRDAETLWRKTIAQNPDCWMAYNNLGVVHFEKGNIEEAVENYQQSLHLHPEYPEAHYNLASALLQKGDVDEAIRQCEEALKIQPNEPDAHIVLGNAFMARQDVGRAINQYEQALTLRLEDSNAHYNLGIALQEKGETERAAREFEQARRFGPHD